MARRLRRPRSFVSKCESGERRDRRLSRSAAYSANDVEAVVKSYWPDAILLGTKSPVITIGADAIKKYFTDLKVQGSGNKNVIQERHTIPIDDNAVLVTGFSLVDFASCHQQARALVVQWYA
jgi:ketosteroid isomerase-like protein